MHETAMLFKYLLNSFTNHICSYTMFLILYCNVHFKSEENITFTSQCKITHYTENFN